MDATRCPRIAVDGHQPVFSLDKVQPDLAVERIETRSQLLDIFLDLCMLAGLEVDGRAAIDGLEDGIDPMRLESALVEDAIRAIPGPSDPFLRNVLALSLLGVTPRG